MLDTINTWINEILPYKGYIIMGAGWFTHVYFPHVVRSYPFVSQNGGALGLAKRYLVGIKHTTTPQPVIIPQPPSPKPPIQN